MYAVGPLDTNNGNDIVLWVAIHSHHECRNNSEEAIFLPYHYAEFAKFRDIQGASARTSAMMHA